MQFAVGISSEKPKENYNDRIDKGKSIIMFPKDYVVVDLETTGLYPKFDEIIEISCLRVRNYEIVDSFSSLAKPEEEICDFITELTGITNEMLSAAPPISQVLPSALAFVGNDIVVGHNVNFDINFLYDACLCVLGKKFSNNFIDTMRIARRLYPELKHHRLRDMVEHLNIEPGKYHRALNDCDMTQKCFKAMHEEILSLYNTEGEFVSLFHRKSKPLDARTLSTTVTEFDTTHPLYGKVCVFTGVLEKMERKNAMQIVLDLGGQCANSVTKKTNFLILGNNDYCSTIKDGKSSKQKKAEEYKLDGCDIEIVPENVFYEMIDVSPEASDL